MRRHALLAKMISLISVASASSARKQSLVALSVRIRILVLDARISTISANKGSAACARSPCRTASVARVRPTAVPVPTATTRARTILAASSVVKALLNA